MAIKISLKELIEAGAHFGHQSRRWNPKMEEYLHGVQDGVHVFDLTKTEECLTEALNSLTETVKEGGVVLFLGSKKQASEKVEEVAKAVEMPYVNERWLGGTITNFNEIQKSIKRLADMKAKREAGEYQSYTKKERVEIDREIERLERFFGGISSLTNIPSALVVIDTKREQAAIKEAIQAGVTTIAIVDSNSDPTQVDYPIPMNDDATKAVEYVLGLMQEAIEEGKTAAKKASKKKEDGKKDN